MWKICLGANGFLAGKLHGYAVTFDQFLDHAAEQGYDGVELHPGLSLFPTPDYQGGVRGLREKVFAKGLQVAGIQACVTEGRVASSERGERVVYSKSCIRQVELCQALGGDQCGFWPAGRQPDLSDGQIIERLVEVFRPVAARARELGVMTTIEPEPVQIDYTYEIGAAIVAAIGSSNFRIIYDCAHAEVMTGDALAAVRRYAGKFGHVHFCDADGTVRDRPGASNTSTHLAAGEGRLDLPAILEALADTGYDRWLQIDVWEHPEPFRCSRETLAAVRAVLG